MRVRMSEAISTEEQSLAPPKGEKDGHTKEMKIHMKC